MIERKSAGRKANGQFKKGHKIRASRRKKKATKRASKRAAAPKGRVFWSKKSGQFCAVREDKWLGCKDTKKAATSLLKKRR